MSGEKKNNKVKRIAVDGVFAAVAITLVYVESLIPPILFMPPGAKLGLSNIVVMFIAMSVGYADAFAIILIKTMFVFLTRGFSSFLMSFCGGVLSFAALTLMLFISEKKQKDLSLVLISIVCGTVHNIGQMAVASIYSHTNLSIYLPALLVFGVLSGFITGLILKIVIPAINKIKF